MRTFLLLYSSDYDGDDDRVPYQRGKSVSAERRSFTVLSSVSWCWWKTLSGWPESPTGHWVRHQLRRLITSKCITANGTKNFKSALLEFPKFFWANIFRHTRLEVCKLILRFAHVGKVFNSIFIHFVCFTLSLIFPEPLKLARYNFHTSCTNEGTN